MGMDTNELPDPIGELMAAINAEAIADRNLWDEARRAHQAGISIKRIAGICDVSEYIVRTRLGLDQVTS